MSALQLALLNVSAASAGLMWFLYACNGRPSSLGLAVWSSASFLICIAAVIA